MVKNYPCTSVFPHFLPSSPSQRLLCLDTTRSRLPARRNASQPSTDVRARTPQTPNRGQRCPLSLTTILTCPPCSQTTFHLFRRISPPTPEKPFVSLLIHLASL